jgi:Holliday junction resolvase-like predicted endonuclease
MNRAARGRTGEQIAASFLSERGYRVLAKNQRTPLGELDLVWWLADRGLLPCAIRFDAVVVELDGQGLPCSLHHLKDVLEA